MRKLLMMTISLILSAAAADRASAEYVRLSGKDVEHLFVGHRVEASYSVMAFRKDGHLGNSKATYTILDDGQVCFAGGVKFTFSTSRSAGGTLAGACFRVVKSDANYLAVWPDSDYEMFMLKILD